MVSGFLCNVRHRTTDKAVHHLLQRQVQTPFGQIIAHNLVRQCLTIHDNTVAIEKDHLGRVDHGNCLV